jgi:hypothetical protein
MASEPIPFDVDRIPELDVLVETARHDRKTRVLKRNGETVAIPSPTHASATKRARRTMPTPRLADPHDIWRDCDPQTVRKGMHQARGAFAGIDIEALIADLNAQRGQDSSGRPAD